MATHSSFLAPIAASAPLLWILCESRTAVAAHRAREATGVSRGDRLFLYTTRGCFNNPVRDRGRIIGRAVVSVPARRADRPVRFGDREYPFLIELEIERLAPFREGLELAPMVPRLPQTFPNAGAWAARLRRSLVSLDSLEADLIDGLLEPLTEPYPAALASYERALVDRINALPASGRNGPAATVPPSD